MPGIERREIRARRRTPRPGVALEEPSLVSQALDWTEGGMDFADALHLAKAQSCEAFASFDRRLTEKAATLASVPVRAP
jgi:predicted nucleic acid-binding protein